MASLGRRSITAPLALGAAALALGVLGAADARPATPGLAFTDMSGSVAQVARLSGAGRTRLTAGGLPGIQPSVENGGLLYARVLRPGQAEIREGRLPITGSRALNISPTWGPNAEETAYRNATNGKVYVTRPDGRQMTRVTPDGVTDADPAFSPDSRFLAVARRGPADAAFGITVLEIGSDMEQLAVIFSTRRVIENADSPSFSPDGARIAFARGGAIWTALSGGGGERRLTAGLPNAFSARDDNPSWSRDGHIYFERLTPGARGVVLRIPAGGGALERVVQAARDPDALP